MGSPADQEKIEETLSELEDMLIETSKTEKQKVKRISKNCGTKIKGIMYAQQEYEKEKQEWSRSNIGSKNEENFPKVMSHQTTDKGSSENSKQGVKQVNKKYTQA